MLATMATVTSGILSPNSYGLNTDPVTLKFTHHAMDTAATTAYHHRQFKQKPTPLTASPATQHSTQTQPNSAANSSDSEPDTYNCYDVTTSDPTSPKNDDISDVNNCLEHHSPKRNKRKNFKPRCSNTSNAFFDHPVHLGENNNVRRRKTAPPPRKVVAPLETAPYSPMDLSGNVTQSRERDSDASNQSDSFDEFNTQKYRNSDCDDDDDEEDSSDFNEESEARSSNPNTIPSSFSIHNLSKPYVSESNVSNKESYHGQDVASGLSADQVAEMRSYAMNTMRELLGIYGLTSEVAESISRQLPMAAFSTGKIFENLSLNSVRKESTPLSEPPTPPSTPLSPKTPSDSKHNLTNFNIPNLTITQQSSHNQKTLPQNQVSSTFTQNYPLSFNRKPPESFSNGLNLASLEFAFEGGSSENETSLNRTSEDGGKNNGGAHRGIFPGTPLSYSQVNKTEPTSPPPLEPSPLNAMMQQSMSASTMQPRDPLNSSNLLISKTTQIDYSKYVKKFASSLECGSTYCKDLSYREHFHCLDCNSRVFIKKEEMIRHFKWHKKRDESLQHGFMRYSPLDDCSDKFPGCTHNKKQTHYHCIQENCDKVYISTSDVQMHSNYHRKDSAIMQEGFQRYRATEECGASHCAFFGQRTTHFHCRRSGCRFTFKNKSDMEKHKSYHIKDEQLSRDGFKKFMKNEACRFDNCRFSRVCNHIHCIRPQCSYVLHSSGQLFSHKRKHERKDSELAYRKYKLAQSMMKTLQDGSSPNLSTAFTSHALSRDYEAQIDLANFYNNSNVTSMSNMSSMSNISNTESLSDRNSPLSYNDESESALAMDLSASETSNFPTAQEEIFNQVYSSSSEDFWKKYCQYIPENNSCIRDNCEYNYQEHLHCIMESCEMVFTSKDGAREHSRNHEQQEIITDNFFTTVTPVDHADFCDDGCIYQNKEKHYHCNIDNCREIILPSDKPFRRLEHYKMHQYSQKLSLTKDPLTATHLTTSIDGMFCRKRGRPPKNRVIEVWNDYNPMGSQSLMDSPQAIFTSFKLPKPSATLSISKEIEQPDDDDRSSTHSTSNMQDYSLQGFDVYGENTKCPDNLCQFLGASHFHCSQIRCIYATDKENLLVVHSKDFHENIEILEGFEFYDRNVDCRLATCPSNKTNRHFHCTRPDCHYSFVQYSQMALHNSKHADEREIERSMPSIRVKSEDQLLVEKDVNNKFEENTQFNNAAINLCQSDNKVSVVRASGTFYPISTVPSSTELHRKSPEIKNHVTEHTSTYLDPSSSSSNTLYGPELSCSRPFCKLKRKYHYHCNACNQAFSELDKLLPHVAKHSSGVLNASGTQEDNNNSGSEPESPQNLSKERESQQQKISVAPLKSLQNPQQQHQQQHQQQQQQHQQQQQEKAQKEVESPYFATPTFDAYNHFTNFSPSFATQIALMQQQNAFLPQTLYQQGIPSQIMFQHAQLLQSPLLSHQNLQNHAFPSENMTSPLAAMAANLNKRAISPHDMSPEAKKARIQSSMRILKDEPVPAGYLRFRFNEDCKYQHCGYREHQTHFHCQRHDCGYSFCDKTRFVQHTARHERLDTLMGGDFQQYRANVACGRPDCAYTANLGSTQNKASHFHCLKCEFVCTDTNKVVAHRRQHQKLDSIQAAGFEKFTPSQICRVQNCQHSGKQTHYHCLSCQYAVLGLAQMSAHKYRHMEG